jgi:uncharacterized protein (DUF697 family)
MASYLDTLERVMKGDYQDASPQEKADAVRDVIQVCSVASAAVAWQPIPFVDTLLISPIQIAMVQAVGRVHGYRLDQKSVVEILGTFGASLIAQNVVMAAAKLVPFAGWIVGMSMAYALTYAVGEVSDHYFRNGRGVDQQDLKEMFEKTYRSKKAEKQAQHRSNASLKDRLEQLKEAYAAGLLTEAEFEAKKQELLAGF